MNIHNALSTLIKKRQRTMIKVYLFGLIGVAIGVFLYAIFKGLNYYGLITTRDDALSRGLLIMAFTLLCLALYIVFFAPYYISKQRIMLEEIRKVLNPNIVMHDISKEKNKKAVISEIYRHFLELFDIKNATLQRTYEISYLNKIFYLLSFYLEDKKLVTALFLKKEESNEYIVIRNDTFPTPRNFRSEKVIQFDHVKKGDFALFTNEMRNINRVNETVLNGVKEFSKGLKTPFALVSSPSYYALLIAPRFKEKHLILLEKLDKETLYQIKQEMDLLELGIVYLLKNPI